MCGRTDLQEGAPGVADWRHRQFGARILLGAPPLGQLTILEGSVPFGSSPAGRGKVTDPQLDIERLSPQQRLRLIEDLWESLRRSEAPLPVSDAQKAELDARLEELERDGPRGIPWDEVVRRIRGAKG
jgi:putative addiction module component (TIGR02574 family)